MLGHFKKKIHKFCNSLHLKYMKQQILTRQSFVFFQLHTELTPFINFQNNNVCYAIILFVPPKLKKDIIGIFAEITLHSFDQNWKIMQINRTFFKKNLIMYIYIHICALYFTFYWFLKRENVYKSKIWKSIRFYLLARRNTKIKK